MKLHCLEMILTVLSRSLHTLYKPQEVIYFLSILVQLGTIGKEGFNQSEMSRRCGYTHDGFKVPSVLLFLNDAQFSKGN